MQHTCVLPGSLNTHIRRSSCCNWLMNKMPHSSVILHSSQVALTVVVMCACAGVTVMVWPSCCLSWPSLMVCAGCASCMLTHHTLTMNLFRRSQETQRYKKPVQTVAGGGGGVLGRGFCVSPWAVQATAKDERPKW
jgi:hypothetical protein